MTTPNPASWYARIAGPGWLYFHAPRHRVHFTVAGLWMALLTRLGMTPNFPFHVLKRNVPARRRDPALLALGIPLAPIALALDAAAASRGCGGTVAVVAEKS